jgi:hypothetical protein
VSYNGSGTFVVNSSGQPVVTGTVISSTAFNALTADLATGLSTAITKDGQTTTTARVPFAQGISSTLVTDATSATTGSIITAGGISCQKAAVVGTLLGVGMAPVNVLDITQTQDTASNISLRNSSTGTSASSRVYLGNSVSATSGRLITWGSGFTSTGVYRQDGLILEGVGAGGVTISANAAQPIYFATNSGERMRIDSTGLVGIGTTSPQTLLTLNAGSGFDGTGEATYHGLIQLAGNYTGTSDLTTVSGIEWKTAHGGGGSGFRQTGLYNSSSGVSTLVFAGRQASASWSTLMTLTSTGNLGIGMTPTVPLSVLGPVYATSAIAAFRGPNSGPCGIDFTVAAGTVASIKFDNTTTLTGNANSIQISTGAGSISFAPNGTECARFDTVGRLLVGLTSTVVGGVLEGFSSNNCAAFRTSGASTSALQCYVSNTGAYLAYFLYSGGNVGSITSNGSTTAYNTTSDYRLKENVQPMTGGVSTVAALKPVTYDWISNGSAGEGFIAHELQAVIPEAVHGEKDAVNEDGSIKPQGVDFGKIVPHLVAAIQELTTRLAALENK